MDYESASLRVVLRELVEALEPLKAKGIPIISLDTKLKTAVSKAKDLLK